MMDLGSLSADELEKLRLKLARRYQDFQSRNLKLDMTRGKPCPEQLDLSLEMLECVKAEYYSTLVGEDYRNYGGLDGIVEAKKLFSQYLDVRPDEIIIGGNSSLNMMHDTIMSAVVQGVVDSEVPWDK
ncbi:MAG: aminotransferase, partial [Proteobacteria bacterium]|nr:aminotransferase [Pseudomonadota bacterium]